MSLSEDLRLDALDGVLDEQVASSGGFLNRVLGGDAPVDTLPSELFAVVDLLETQPTLRRALSDPGTPEQARQNLAEAVLKGKVSKATIAVVSSAASARWRGARTFVAALERQAIRAELARAEGHEQLDDTEDELFRFARLVKSTPGLRDAMSDRSVPVGRRQDLIADLLQGKTTEATVTLAKRAVLARERTFDHTVESYVTLAAAMRNRVVATVRVARPLTETQLERMRAALARQVGRPVQVQVIVDENVLGGVRVELGDEVIEGTVAAKLENARRLFT